MSLNSLTFTFTTIWLRKDCYDKNVVDAVCFVVAVVVVIVVVIAVAIQEMVFAGSVLPSTKHHNELC